LIQGKSCGLIYRQVYISGFIGKFVLKSPPRRQNNPKTTLKRYLEVVVRGRFKYRSKLSRLQQNFQPFLEDVSKISFQGFTAKKYYFGVSKYLALKFFA
jgi:hypothetical protein